MVLLHHRHHHHHHHTHLHLLGDLLFQVLTVKISQLKMVAKANTLNWEAVQWQEL
jgi:Co/Zn/Cd efflux system component